MAKKHKHEEHENHERWLVSYADFITLLFAFFVVMYSVSRVDQKRVVQASQSIRWALHFSGSGGVGELPIFQGPPAGMVAAAGGSGRATAAPEALKQIEAVKRRIEKKIKAYLQERKATQSVAVELANGKLTIRLSATSFFDPAQAALRPEMIPVLDAIASELKQMKRPVRVEAHTDASGVASRFRNNWELSAARASTVTAFLEEGHQMPAELLTAAGMSSAHPLVPNDTPEHREMNRRVEMVVDFYSSDISSTVAK
ncbi:MAG: flagellar motor protein MotB [Myxococcaceae bacterium]|nr:flagellar motor protein MotB [Myxococcaceae bacterium]